ncbi:MAG: fasciclin domain-containing protein [Maioricimonas sp. JB049]
MKRPVLFSVALLALFAVSNRPSRAAEQSDIVDTAVAAGSFNTLATALKSAGLVDALKKEGPFTVFAPTDEAFDKLPEGTVENLLKPENRDQLTAILTYHVVPGKVMAEQVVGLNGAISLNGQRIDIKAADDKVQVDGAQVVKTDIACSNGVIHVIDRVILPATEDIPTTASNASQFNTLLTAVNAAGLAGVLSGEGPFTVFAPTDDAFARLPEGTVESLLEPQNRDQLTAILKYHVVSGRIYSEQALDAGKAKTLQGTRLRIRVVDGKAKVNKAGLVATDIDASNGVIHVIDTVLLPPKGKKSAEVAPPAAAPVAAAPVHASKSRQSSCGKSTVRTFHTSAPRRVVRYHYSR